MPEARCGSRAFSIWLSSARGTLSRRALSASSAAPLFQVHITTTMAKPNANGTQAPSGILSALAEKNVRSTAPRGMTRPRVCSRLHFHSRRTTTAASRVSTNIEPVTAMP